VNLADRLKYVTRGDHRDQSPSRDDSVSKVGAGAYSSFIAYHPIGYNCCPQQMSPEGGLLREQGEPIFVAEMFLKGTPEVTL